ncbi:group-specific protein [Cytobacillus oceanisediminis]|uniref:group-specific protein n=1 Tax=Cytobacillus oceanisediminis TaxID=665099 RepID=UPI00207AAC25|nr:group-specific protein [Cytobacillus oceanisediminis]USK43758.1 group-specific protein [Cytobacillus oceanisediminis]
MIEIQVNEAEIKAMYQAELQKRLDQLENEVVFWDTKELKRQTNMSWNTIQDYFFHDPTFPKFKLNQKWYFPAKECREFLVSWAENMSQTFARKEAM